MAKRNATTFNFADLSPYVKKEFNYIARQQPVYMVEGTLSEVTRYRRIGNKLPAHEYLACEVTDGVHFFAIYLKHPRFPKTMFLISRTYTVIALDIECDRPFVCDIILSGLNTAIIHDVYMYDHKYLATFEQQRYPAVLAIAATMKISGYNIEAQEFWEVDDALTKLTCEWEGIYFFPKRHNFFRGGDRVLFWTQPLRETFDYEVLAISDEVNEPRTSECAMTCYEKVDRKDDIRPSEMEIVTSDDEEEQADLYPYVYITVRKYNSFFFVIRVENSSRYSYELEKVYRFKYVEEGYFRVLMRYHGEPSCIKKFSLWKRNRKYKADVLRWVDNG